MKKSVSLLDRGKATGSSGIVAELKSSDVVEQIITVLISAFVKECTMPDDRSKSKSVIMNAYKGKGDRMVRSNYRGLKLME